MRAITLKSFLAICGIIGILSVAPVAKAQSSGTLSAGGIVCTPFPPLFVPGGSTVTITGTSVKASNPSKPIAVKWSVWAGETSTDFTTRIFVLPDSSSVSQSGILVPRFNNGNTYVEACLNNNTTVDISYTLGLTAP